ncbi:MAG TPA: TetR family transcriptional regulator [Pseudomonadales bacterium]|nr:TetR family transcriptional regulator [Pseudomonadales bacterium]
MSASESSSPVNYRGRRVSRSSSENRRKAILEAAMRLIVRDGVRAVRHRAVAKEAGVPLSATTYYFADISELIADTFTLFAEQNMGQIVEPLTRKLFEFFASFPGDTLTAAENRSKVIDGVIEILIELIHVELTEKRESIVAERVFLAEAIRDVKLGALALAYQEELLRGIQFICHSFGVEEVETTAHLILYTILSLEYEALLVPPENYDYDRARAILRRQLTVLIGSPKSSV